MDKNTFFPKFIFKWWNSLAHDESQKLGWIRKATGQNKKSLLLPGSTEYTCGQGRAGFHLTC